MTVNPNSNQAPTAATYDLAILGNGVHAASLAAEAASRGLRTALISGDDLVDSSSGFCQITGGNLHALENFALSEVSTNFNELARLQSRAPHLVRPLATRVLRRASARSDTRVRVGLLLYNRLRPPRLAAAKGDSALLDDLRPNSTVAGQSVDCDVNEMRLTLALAQQARGNGADLFPRHPLSAVERGSRQWQLVLRSPRGDLALSATLLINCEVARCDSPLSHILVVPSRCQTRCLVSGQLFLRRAQQWQSAAILQLDRGELAYLHPYSSELVCLDPITAERDSDPAKQSAVATALDALNPYLREALDPTHIVHQRWRRSAVVDDPGVDDDEQCLFDLNNPGGGAALLNLYGRNLAQHRRLAEQGLNILEAFTGAKANPDFARQALPGGDMVDFDSYLLALQAGHPLPAALLSRWANAYGSRCDSLLADIASEADLGVHFGHQLYQREVDYLVEHEWALSAEDILWRRTDLGLLFSERQQANLARYLGA